MKPSRHPSFLFIIEKVTWCTQVVHRPPRGDRDVIDYCCWSHQTVTFEVLLECIVSPVALYIRRYDIPVNCHGSGYSTQHVQYMSQKLIGHWK